MHWLEMSLHLCPSPPVGHTTEGWEPETEVTSGTCLPKLAPAGGYQV